MQRLIFLGKIGVGLFWLAVLANLALPLPAPYAMWLSLAGLASLIAHVLQSLAFASHNKLAPHKGRDITQILLFGAVHLMSVRARSR